MRDISARTVGILYIVATPIGNQEDLSPRALATLQMVDFILAEDTRHSKLFLTQLGVNTPLISLHEHNEANKSNQIIEALLNGHSYALISDAGTPLISDPGFVLVKLAREKQIQVVPIPGASACITALSAAGIAADIFTFCGFLPAKQTARLRKLKSLSNLTHTLIFYESTHRIIDSITDFITIFGDDCSLVLAKELTKTFENFISGNGATIIEWLQADHRHCKGEFVLLVPPRTQHEEDPMSQAPMLSILLAELPLKQAVKLASQLTSVPKNELYQLALSLK